MEKITLPFEREQVPKRSIKDRVSGRSCAVFGYACAKNAVLCGEFDKYAIDEIAASSSGDLFSDFHKEWLDLLDKIISHFLESGPLSHDEENFVARYCQAFRIESSVVKECYQRVACQVFFNHALNRDPSTRRAKEDMVELSGLAKSLRIKDPDKVYKEAISALLCSYLDSKICDDQLSPEEWTAFRKACEAYGVEPRLDPFLSHGVKRARALWSILNGPLQEVAIEDLRLGVGELAYFDGRCKWYEITGRASDLSEKSTVYQQVASGRAILTSERLLFLADTGSNKSIKWKSLLQVLIREPDQIECVKERGKSPVIVFDAEPFGAAQLAVRLHGEVI